MKILFLDIDGVLNRCGHSAQGLEDDKVALLKDILDCTGAKVVLSSTWRILPRNLARVEMMLESIGHELDSITCRSWFGSNRGMEIQEWLDKHSNPDVFVILDDDCDMGPLLPHLVNTDSFVGLTPEIAMECIRRLNLSV